MGFFKILASLLLIPALALGEYSATRAPTKKKTKKAHDAVAVAAVAPPQPTVASFRWDGLYGGLNLGLSYMAAKTSFSPLPNAASFINFLPTSLTPKTPDNLLTGAQLGYNVQMTDWVVGIVSDVDTGLACGVTQTPIIQNDGTPFPNGGHLTAGEQINWFGTTRLRAGWIYSDFLFFGSGGLVYGDVVYTANTNFRPSGTAEYNANFKKYKVGYTFGGGAEWAFASNWTTDLEYLFYNLGDQESIVNPIPQHPPYQMDYQWKTQGSIFRLGLNYKFF